MPTRNISLTAEQDTFIDELVERGDQNASDARRALQQRRKQDELKLELLRTQVIVGVHALERGEATEIEEGELDRYLAARSRPRAQRPQRKRAR